MLEDLEYRRLHCVSVVMHPLFHLQTQKTQKNGMEQVGQKPLIWQLVDMKYRVQELKAQPCVRRGLLLQLVQVYQNNGHQVL